MHDKGRILRKQESRKVTVDRDGVKQIIQLLSNVIIDPENKRGVRKRKQSQVFHEFRIQKILVM